MSQTILVADDNRQIRMLVKAALRSGGYEIVEAEDGEQAVELVTQEPPDLVLLDVMMPKLDGFEVLHFLRKRPETSSVRVVMLTTAAQETDRERAEAEGVEGYVVKPFEPTELKRVVAEALAEGS